MIYWDVKGDLFIVRWPAGDLTWHILRPTDNAILSLGENLWTMGDPWLFMTFYFPLIFSLMTFRMKTYLRKVWFKMHKYCSFTRDSSLSRTIVLSVCKALFELSIAVTLNCNLQQLCFSSRHCFPCLLNIESFCPQRSILYTGIAFF